MNNKNEKPFVLPLWAQNPDCEKRQEDGFTWYIRTRPDGLIAMILAVPDDDSDLD